MTKTEVEVRLKDYRESLASMDVERWVGEFAENGTVEDPVGGPVVSGTDELKRFFKQVGKTFTTLQLTPEFEIIAPPEASGKWSALGITHSGKKVTFEGISSFKFNEYGKIIQMRAFWDQKAVVRKLMA